MTQGQTVVVHTEYVETLILAPVAFGEVEKPELDWRRIGQGAGLGALFGVLASATAGGFDSSVAFVACAVNVASAFAIIGGLWGAVFFSPEHAD
jgi:hypothetical protein